MVGSTTSMTIFRCPKLTSPHQTHEADDPGEADHGGGDEGDEQPGDTAQPPHIAPQGHGALIPGGEQIIVPCPGEEDGQGDAQHRRGEQDLGPGGLGQAPEGPVDNGGELLLVGDVLHPGVERGEKVVQRDTHQYDGGISGRIVPDIFFLSFSRIAGQHVFGDSACRYPAHFLRIGFQQGIHEFVCDWDTCPHLSAFSDWTQFYKIPGIRISSVFILVGYDCCLRYHHFLNIFGQFIHDAL